MTGKWLVYRRGNGANGVRRAKAGWGSRGGSLRTISA